MPRPSETASDQHEAEKRGPKTGLSPSRHSTTSSVGKVPSPIRGPYPQTSDDDATSDVGLVDPSCRRKGRRNRGNRGSQSGESSDSSHSTRSSTSSGGRRKKKDGFSSKIQILEFGGKKGHSGDVTDAFRQWARCITYYRDYYEDSYLMPLVVSSLTGDASDVFDWILSLNHGEPQDLTTLLQMLREHYCGSLTFREQRNTIENLRQKSNEAAIDFLIRVGTSVSNLAKDWKDELTEVPSYLEEAIPDDPVLQVKVAHALRVQEMNSRRCFTCNRPGHLTRDHQEWEEKNGIRPLQSKGPTLNKVASEKAKQKPSQPGRPGPPKE